MNINEKVKTNAKNNKIKFVMPSQRPIYTPEFLKSDLNGSLWLYKENKLSLVLVIFLLNMYISANLHLYYVIALSKMGIYV